MQEQCEREDDQVTINTKVMSGANVRSAGEDIKQGSVVLKAGTLLRHQELGLLASVGLARIPVYRRIKVGVFFTGDELVEPGHALAPGQIYNSNRYTLIGMLKALGCEVIDFGIVEDNLSATRYVLDEVSNAADFVITSGGVSVGEEDYVRIALEQLGELSLWRIAMKPGNS
jgi:molybdopterin molybdotransferase